MRTDKIITIIFSSILGLIGLFTVYILVSSFLYDTGIIGGDDYASVESMLEEDNDFGVDNPVMGEEVIAKEDSTSSSQYLDSSQETNEIAAAENTETQNNEKKAPIESNFEEAQTPQASEVQEPVRTPVSKNTESPSNTESASVTSNTPLSNAVKTSASTSGTGNRKARYEALKEKFNYGTDASGAGWFVHKTWDNPAMMRNALICYVNQQGEVNLATQYVGDSRIYHAQAQIMLENNTLNTAEALENDLDYSSQGGGIKERVQYRSGNNKAILDQLINNMSNEITVTLLGNEQVLFTLSDADKQALKDCKEMADLLSYL